MKSINIAVLAVLLSVTACSSMGNGPTTASSASQGTPLISDCNKFEGYPDCISGQLDDPAATQMPANQMN